MANRKSLANITYNNEIAVKTKEDIERLTIENLGLVKSILDKFNIKDVNEYDEMLQCGRIGLWKAIKYHNPLKGKLSTVAYRHIFWEMLEHLRQKKRYSGKVKKICKRIKIKDLCVEEDIIIDDVYPDLSQREIDIVNDVMYGYSRKEIAKKNKMKLGTLKKMVRNIFKKIKEANE